MIYLSIILVNYNGIDFLDNCLNSIKQFVKFCDYEVIIVDNFSVDDSINKIKDILPSAILIFVHLWNLSSLQYTNPPVTSPKQSANW